MATYKGPKKRSMDVLNATQFYQKPGSVLDVSKYVNTSVPAGSNGKLIRVGDHLEEANRPGVKIRLVGNSTSPGTYKGGYDKTKADRIVEKYRAKGINYIRIHGPEMYVFSAAGLYSTWTSTRVGTLQFIPERLDEMDYLLYKLGQGGIYWGLGVMSSNLGFDIGNTSDRWDSNPNSSGSLTTSIDSTTKKLTGITIVNGGSNYYTAPTVVIVGGNGVGARARATLTNGVVTGIEITNPGMGYTSPPTAYFVGGNGQHGLRLRYDSDVREHYTQLITMLLNHVNPYTGLAWKDDPALCFVEALNEFIVTGKSWGSIYIPLYQEFLYKRYGGDISKLNAKRGTNYQGFGDMTTVVNGVAGLVPDYKRSYNNSNKAYNWNTMESWIFTSELDREIYDWCTSVTKSAGYSGPVSGQDLAFGPFAARALDLDSNEIQSIHCYGALQDSYVANTLISVADGRDNGPWYQNFLSMGTVLNQIPDGKPKIFTEANMAVPAKYRGEFGIVFSAVCSMHDFSGLAIHGDSLNKFNFGVNPPYGTRGLLPLAFEHDPTSIGATFLTSTMFHRGDIDVVPTDVEVLCNEKALGWAMNPDEIPTGSTPQFVGNQFFTYDYMGNAATMFRVKTRWDRTNSSEVAEKWITQTGQNFTSWVKDLNLPKDHETYDWVINKGNDDQFQNLRPFKGALYSRNKQFFADQISGITGINTPKTQIASVSADYAIGMGNVVKDGDKFVNNPGRSKLPIAPRKYVTNYLGNRFWDNLEINYADEAVFLGVTSANNLPIKNERRLIVVMSGNCYNYDAKWKSYGATVTSIPVLRPGFGYTLPPEVSLLRGGEASKFKAVAELEGGFVTKINILKGGNGVVGTTFKGTVSGNTLTISEMEYGSVKIYKASNPAADQFESNDQDECTLYVPGVGTAVVTGYTSGTRGGVGVYTLGSSLSSPTSQRLCQGATPYTILQPGGTSTTGVLLGPPVLQDDDPEKEVLLESPYAPGSDGWPVQVQTVVADFNLVGIDNSQPWILYELDYLGDRVASYPTTKIPNGINVRIDSAKTVKPTVFYELVRGEEYYEPRD